jgi:signal transduction histidine kinase
MRLRIARDLHDEVGSDLGGIGLISQRLEKYKGLPHDVKNELSEISQASFNTSEKLRDIVWFVNPEHDKSEHLILRLKDLAGRLLREIEYTFSIDSRVTFQNFDLESRHQLNLIFKETLHNIVQHANANKVEIQFKQERELLRITIKDNGKGFLAESYKQSWDEKIVDTFAGMGLINIHRRAKLIGATVTIQSEEGCGTTVMLSMKMP